MGIPYYFRKIWDNYPDVVINNIELVYDLYFDFNGIVHWAATKTAEERTYQKKYHDSYEDAILKNIDERIDQIFKLVNPQKQIGFFVDGPAVRAKMKQQLQRRSKGPVELALRDDIKAHYGEEVRDQHFDRSSITPGTPFMTKLNTYIRKLATKYNHLDVIISDSNDPGEGEHKLFNYLKRHRNNLFIDDENPDNSHKIVIVGLDADLIMLSLVSHFENIYLMRESTERNMVDADNIFTFLDIGFFRKLLIGDIRYEITSIDKSTLYQSATTEAIIDDYIFMCFLLGNDFLPHSPALSIKDKGINRLIKYYISVFNELEQHLVIVSDRDDPDKISVNINLEPVSKLITLIANDEDYQMKKVYNNRCKLEDRPPRNYNSNNKPSSNELHRLQYLPAFEVGKELDLEINGFPGWKKIYFNHVLRMKRTEANINDICQNYLEGLKWVLEYYYTETHTWGWIYSYIGAPVFQDLAKYLHECDTFPSEPKENERYVAYSPFSQLMMVISKKSASLLPTPLKLKMTSDDSELAYYYPDEFELNMYFHTQFWETEPILPIIDEQKVETIVKSAPLSQDELKRNSFSKLEIIKKKK